jgi:hypothetical protein
MSIPTITLTMLGANGSGKTAFLLGMYMSLHSGVHGYSMITQDRDDHYDLRDAWRLLKRQGELPPPNGQTPIQHHFLFKHDFESLLHLDVEDFRGNAGLERANSPGAHADVAQLRTRLRNSDSIYIALDGEDVGGWIKRGCAKETTDWAEDIYDFNSYVKEAADAQRNSGRPPVSVVILITKADRLPAITGLTKGEASEKAADNLDRLVDAAFMPGVTALICPVQIGDLGPTPSLSSGQAHKVDPSKLDPRYLHKPVLFSLMHYLTEQISTDSIRLSSIENQQAAARQEMTQLRDAWFGLGGFFHSDRIQAASRRLDADVESARSISAGLATARERAGQLMAELDMLPIVKDGKRL